MQWACQCVFLRRKAPKGVVSRMFDTGWGRMHAPVGGVHVRDAVFASMHATGDQRVLNDLLSQTLAQCN